MTEIESFSEGGLSESEGGEEMVDERCGGEPVDFTFAEEPLTLEPGEVLTIRSQDMLKIGPEPRKAKCVICDKEFLLDNWNLSMSEGTSIKFSVSSGTSDAYDICHECFLWAPKMAVKALRRIHAEPLLLSGGTGGETPIPSSDSWECNPGGDLSISP